jgi:hypothetical protein
MEKIIELYKKASILFNSQDNFYQEEIDNIFDKARDDQYVYELRALEAQINQIHDVLIGLRGIINKRYTSDELIQYREDNPLMKWYINDILRGR